MIIKVCLSVAWILLDLLMGSTCAQAAVPNDLLTAGFKVFSADINGDGCPDYLAKRADMAIVVPIDDDLVVLSIPQPTKSVLLLSAGGCQYSAAQAPTLEQLGDSRWAPSSYQVVAGDVQGTGGGSLLLVPGSAANNLTFNLARDGATQNFSLLQALQMNNVVDVSGQTVTLEYANSDSRTDLVVRSGSTVVAVYAAGPDGRFQSGTSDPIALVTVVWNGFSAALKSSTPTDALQFIAPASRDRYAVIINRAGTNVAQFANAVKRFDVITVSDDYVEAVITVTQPDGDWSYFVKFGKDPDGMWRIYSM